MVKDNAVSSSFRSPKPGKKYFNLEEAERSVSYVSRIVADLMRCYCRIADIRREVESLPVGSEYVRLNELYEAEKEKFGTFLEELHEIGLEIKDLRSGLVDFPAIHEGREICLCWRLGERTIVAWHEIDVGFSDRQSVDLLKSQLSS
ncbi:MAG: DUF2203 domain-containing protein [Parcubacteria group bacterium]|nr:DUF2203 domain-containing protein [Parcubacteria group bacterium]